jgi:hypothetical protein
MKNLKKFSESSLKEMDFSQMYFILGGTGKKPQKTNDVTTTTHCTDPNDSCTNGDTLTQTQTDTEITVTVECD